jgi:tetratricopeptide (TPR) repeat protein
MLLVMRRSATENAPILHGLGRIAAACVLLGAVASQAAEPNPRERIDFWRRNYPEVRPEADVRAQRAQTIFERLVRIAGRRPGVEPRLLVIADESLGSLPIAIPDGWVILSRRIIDFCYRSGKLGDDRLAFVLAHEIAHLLDGDFWHMQFFQAIEGYEKGAADQEVLGEVRKIAALTDKVLAKELRADELGITYVAVAGFNPRAVLGDAESEDFFHEWIAMLDPARLGSQKMRTHPEPSQRAATVKARLLQVAEQSELFNLGLLYYQAGDYPRAILAFDEFRRYFPGREVQNNLGAAHHQLALRLWRPLADKRGEPLYKLSVTIDPLSRARSATRGSQQTAAQTFERHIAAAIDHYQTAVNQDPTYLPAYLNLGGAYIARGEAYKAIAVLQDAQKLAPRDAAVLNDLGVAFVYAKNPAEARSYLGNARKSEPAYDAPLFNLASLAQQQGNTEEAARYAKMYLERDTGSDWADIARSRFGAGARVTGASSVSSGPEALAGLEVGAYDNEVPASWGKPVTQSFRLEAVPTRLARYPNGITTVSEGDEVRLIVATSSYSGTSGRGIRIGQSRQEVESRYGASGQVLVTTVGESLMYPSRGLTFSLRDGRVASWLHYWD